MSGPGGVEAAAGNKDSGRAVGHGRAGTCRFRSRVKRRPRRYFIRLRRRGHGEELPEGHFGPERHVGDEYPAVCEKFVNIGVCRHLSYTTSIMAAASYEVEIKSLLGDAERAHALVERMRALEPGCALRASSTQLNHYFEGGDPAALAKRLAPHLSEKKAAELERVVKEGRKISVRTRGENGNARIVMKASIGSDSSENGVMRAEFEEVVPDFSLDALDTEVLAAGYRYQAKWSRSREEYAYRGANVCLDKNAGYGYLAEFEKVIDDAAGAEGARAALLALMRELGVEELPQDRLERMFAHYNAHWPEYYGTDKMFTIQ